MGLDMVPMGKPKPGYETRFVEIFGILSGNEQQSVSFLDKLRGKKPLTQEQLLQEWFNIQIPSYETIGAPMVGRDAIAEEWARAKYRATNQPISEEEFIKNLHGYYVIELATKQDGLPKYISMSADENAFRGQMLDLCKDVIGEELVYEAWESKLAEEALDYGNRLLTAVDAISKEKGLQYLNDIKYTNEPEPGSLEEKVHIIYSLARWLTFYGSHGHGYNADY